MFNCTVHPPVLCILVTLSLAYSTGGIGHGDKQRNEGANMIHKLFSHARHKRTVYLAEKGTTALKNIIASGKKVWSRSKTFRRYDKTGDLRNALDDFYSFKPDNVQEIRAMSDKVLVITGTIGNKKLRLRVDGDRFSLRRPVLEVIDTDTSKRPYIDRIIYRE